MFNSEDIYTALNVSDITDLLDTYVSTPALWEATRIPQSFTGTESINYYMSGTANGGLEYGDYVYSINCRSATEAGVKIIAQAVYDEINRGIYSDYSIKISVLPIIPPADDTDLYNIPIEAVILSKA